MKQVSPATLAARCPYRAGWCEKDAGHEGTHYTTYRDDEIWTLPDQPDALRPVSDHVLRETLLQLRRILEPMTRMDSLRDDALGLVDAALATSAAAGEGGADGEA